MSAQLLDRPAWHALRGRQAALALGSERALRFQPDVSPFAATLDDGEASLRELGTLISPGETIALLQREVAAAPAGCEVAKVAYGVQMIACRKLSAPADLGDVVRLGDADAADMLELATLTAPGPFLPRTHRLGGFFGVRAAGRLVAMAGERLKPPGFTEVSGVCTHPDHQGRGYARLLSQLVAARIAARGETPMLHAYADNDRAIELYRALGFELRCEMRMTVLHRPE